MMAAPDASTLQSQESKSAENLQVAKNKGGRSGSPSGQKQGGGKDPGKQPKLGPKKPETPKPGKTIPENPREIEDWINGDRGVLPGPNWDGWDSPPGWVGRMGGLG